MQMQRKQWVFTNSIFPITGATVTGNTAPINHPYSWLSEWKQKSVHHSSLGNEEVWWSQEQVVNAGRIFPVAKSTSVSFPGESFFWRGPHSHVSELLIFSLLVCIQATEKILKSPHSITFLKDPLTECKPDHLKAAAVANVPGEGTVMCILLSALNPAYLQHLSQQRHGLCLSGGPACGSGYPCHPPDKWSGHLPTTQEHLSPQGPCSEPNTVTLSA